MAGMRIGIFTGADCPTPEALVARAVDAEARGYSSVWVPQTPSFDALSALCAVALRTSTIELGTGVVPVQTRHPATMAQQALTVASLAGGRTCLGIGATHRPVSEGWWGVPYTGIVDVVREHVSVIASLFATHKADLDGASVTAHMAYPEIGPSPTLVLAALGPKMLEIAGAATSGTFTWMTGPRTLAERTVGPLRDAASRVGAPAPRVIAGLPICLASDPAAARAFIEPRIAYTAMMPSYKRAIEWEGASSPADLVLLGDEATLREKIAELESVGVTDFCANIVGPDEDRAATFAFLGDLARERSAR